MGQISVKFYAPTGSLLSGNLHRKLVKLGVRRSWLDTLTAAELGVVARLILEKQGDCKHSEDGLWMTLWRAGVIDFPAAGFTEDEAAAVQASTGAEEAFVAKKFLEAIVGKKLEISPAFALALVTNYHASEKSRGLRLTNERIGDKNVDKDLRFILNAVGLGDEHQARAWDIWEKIYWPELAEFEQRRADEQEAQSNLEAQYLPAARQYREMEAKRRAKRSEEEQSAEQSDSGDPDVTGLTEAITEPSSECLEGAHFGEDDSMDAERQENAVDRERIIAEDRLLYNQSMRGIDGAYDNDRDRLVARWLAQSKRYRAKLRNRGIDVPEPDMDDANGPNRKSDKASSEWPPPDAADMPVAQPRGMTRAERNARMKVKL